VSGPLAGIKVLELQGIGPGPYACMLLAELGADVLRVDRPGGGSAMVPPEKELLHRSRPCAAVDLKRLEGRQVVLDLVATADVLVEGMRPGTTERLGLGPDECLAINPRLVYARMTGWGQDGPRRLQAGHDINYASLTGALHAIGTSERPVVPLNLIADFGGGSLFLVMGVLSALLERGTSGRGQVVDAAMVDGAASLITMVHSMLGSGLWRDQRASNLLDGGAPFYDIYACADGRHVAVGAIEPQFYRALVEGLDLVDELGTKQYAVEEWPQSKALLAARFRTRTRDEWAAHFGMSDACVTPVLSLTEAPADAHMVARGTFVDGVPGPAPRFSRTPTSVRSAARRPGQDTAEVLQAWGMPPERVQELLSKGAVSQGS